MAATARPRDGVLERGVVPAIAAAAMLAGFVHGAVARRGRGVRRPADETPLGDVAESGIKGRLRKRWSAIGYLFDVQAHVNDVSGARLAAAVAFQAFLSLFPLILVVVAAVGFFSANRAGVADAIVAELGLSGEAAETMMTAIRAAEDSRRVASVVGLAGLLWSGIAMIGVLQFAYNRIWGVEPRRGIRPKLVALGWLVGAGLLFATAALLTAALNYLPALLAPVGIVFGLGVNFTLWLWTSKVLPNRDVGWRALIPGALVGAAGLEVLKVAGAIYIPRVVESSSQLYGSIGVVFALLAWLLLFSRLVVYAEALNAVLHTRRTDRRGAARAT